ncbi:MAG TPA: M20/M25/M40 family metallo-hydrolase, partial [Vicinamibacterales bacterium]|nr:M20/M25/M40 family metallo-hydrolase [Vicinamibacterales bacterium]
MTRLLASATVLAMVLLASASTDSARLHDANLAWERGDYVAALKAYLQMLDAPGADEVFEPIALQTGELYYTVELTADGAAPLFSPDERHLTYETGAGLQRVIRLLPSDGSTTPVAELTGTGAAFSPDGSKLAYLRLAAPSPQLREAQAALDAAAGGERAQRQAAVNRLVAAESQIAVRDIATTTETIVDTGGTWKTAVMLGAGGAILFSGLSAEGPPQIYLVAAGEAPRAVTSGEGLKTLVAFNSTGSAALFTVRAGGGGRGGGRGGAGGAATFGVVTLPEGKVTTVRGSAPAFSADGASLAYIAREGADSMLMVGPATNPSAATAVRKGPERIDAPALSPDGSRIAFQMMPREDWEIFVVSGDGKEATRLTREIQHDLMPQFLAPNRLLAVMGEARHRRSYIYDLDTGRRSRLFHNNTVRTIAPESVWVPSSSGAKVLFSAERDGDTVSPERGIYLMDLSRKVTREELRARVAGNLAAEQALRAKGQRMYAPIAAAVKGIVDQASVDRVFAYQARLFSFDSKHITRPGNRLASEYLFETYKSFGYEPEYQWFEGRNALGGKTANVLATLTGTVNPELVYVVSSHYDSVAGGPGADDDSSGTAALLEAARILVKHPQPATIVFASFTGEEAGLLGSREFVRQAVANRVRIVGALNNDMIGWANDQRLDNTIRYSNPGIRDIQHSAAMQFTRLITYDALYYKSTDAAAYYEAYGDIVGGIGSYPVLGNPHYHQSHDVLETINHQLVTEVARTTAATLMLLASSPSRLAELNVVSFGGGVAALSWQPSPEKGVTGYIVAWGPPDS